MVQSFGLGAGGEGLRLLAALPGLLSLLNPWTQQAVVHYQKAAARGVSGAQFNLQTTSREVAQLT